MEQLTIIGLGLIGGSIGLALRAAKLPNLEVVGFDTERGISGDAKKIGAIDRAAPSLREAVKSSRMIVLATPPLSMRGVMQEMSEHLTPGAIVTDVASTKLEVRRWAQEFLPENVHYIGGHPMAGKETQGIKYAEATLFKGATYCIIPSPQASEASVKSVMGLANVLGAEPLFIDAEEHDQYAAAISHMPLVVSTALFTLVRSSPAWSDIAPLAAGGFRDVTRLASGDPRMSHDIMSTNAEGIVHWIDRLIEELGRYRTMIKTDRKALFSAFTEAQLKRDAFLLGERPSRRPEVEMPSARDAMSSMFLGGYLAQRQQKLEKDLQDPKRKRSSVLDDDD